MLTETDTIIAIMNVYRSIVPYYKADETIEREIKSSIIVLLSH